MLRQCICIVWMIFVVSSVHAQTVIDGSDKLLPPELAKELVDIASSKMKDPLSSQIRQLRIGKDRENGATTYCGYINAKNSYGAYVGFRPFFIGPTKKGAVVDTGESPFLAQAIQEIVKNSCGI